MTDLCVWPLKSLYQCISTIVTIAFTVIYLKIHGKNLRPYVEGGSLRWSRADIPVYSHMSAQGVQPQSGSGAGEYDDWANFPQYGPEDWDELPDMHD